MASKRAMATKADYVVSGDALIQAVVQSHENTNRLMEVQFVNVKDNFDRIHRALATAKSDLEKELASTKKEVDENRKLAEERHLSLVKKIWMGIGGVAMLEVLASWHPWAKL